MFVFIKMRMELRFFVLSVPRCSNYFEREKKFHEDWCSNYVLKIKKFHVEKRSIFSRHELPNICPWHLVSPFRTISHFSARLSSAQDISTNLCWNARIKPIFSVHFRLCNVRVQPSQWAIVCLVWASKLMALHDSNAAICVVSVHCAQSKIHLCYNNTRQNRTIVGFPLRENWRERKKRNDRIVYFKYPTHTQIMDTCDFLMHMNLTDPHRFHVVIHESKAKMIFIARRTALCIQSIWPYKVDAVYLVWC